MDLAYKVSKCEQYTGLLTTTRPNLCDEVDNWVFYFVLYCIWTMRCFVIGNKVQRKRQLSREPLRRHKEASRRCHDQLRRGNEKLPATHVEFDDGSWNRSRTPMIARISAEFLGNKPNIWIRSSWTGNRTGIKHREGTKYDATPLVYPSRLFKFYQNKNEPPNFPSEFISSKKYKSYRLRYISYFQSLDASTFYNKKIHRICFIFYINKIKIEFFKTNTDNYLY